MDTPEIKSVGDFGIPVSLSYSLELSVSKAIFWGLWQILILKWDEHPKWTQNSNQL